MKMRRKSRLGVGLACSALLITAVSALPAHAGTTPPWNVDDAVVATAGEPAKANFPDLSGNSKELGPINGASYKVLVIHGTPVPVLGLSNPNAGTDMTQAWIDTDIDGDGDIWGYFAFQIESFSTGQSAWEFMKDPAPAGCNYTPPLDQASLIANCNPWANRDVGDFFIVADYQGNGVTLGYRVWQDGGGGSLVLGPLVNIPTAVGKGSVNATTGVVEMAVNLTDAVFGDLTSCRTIGNIIPSTLTGNSDQADYKDVILGPVAEAVNISNCGSLVVTKKLNPSDASTDGNTFEWTVDRSGGGALRYDVADDPDQNGETELTGTLTAHDDSDGPETDLIAGTDYQLDEVIKFTAPDIQAFDLEKIECKVGSTGTLVDVTGGTFTVAVSETTYCEITNKQRTGTLKVYKVVTNDNGGELDRTDFTVDVTGPNSYSQQDQGFGEDPDNAGDLDYGLWTMQVPAGTYTAVEDDPSSAGYTKDDSACASVVVPAGGEGSCTITNTDDPATLIVNKVVVNTAAGDGGAVATDFLFDVSGVNASQDNGYTADPADDEKGSTTLTGLSAGAYGVTEDGATAATPSVIVVGGITYHVTYSTDCTGTLALGGSKTCTITNTAQKANPSGTTVQSWVLHDELTLSGVRGDPEGDTITFTLYSDASCTTAVGSDTGTVDANGKAETSTGVAVTDSGTYYWRAAYPGDALNNGFTTACGDEVTQILAKDQGRDDFTPAG